VKRRWVWSPEAGELIEVTANYAPKRVAGPYVQGNFTPVMGIDDRGRARRYLRARNLVPYEEPKKDPSKARADRAHRVATLSNAYEYHRDQARAKGRYG